MNTQHQQTDMQPRVLTCTEAQSRQSRDARDRRRTKGTEGVREKEWLPSCLQSVCEIRRLSAALTLIPVSATTRASHNSNRKTQRERERERERARCARSFALPTGHWHRVLSLLLLLGAQSHPSSPAARRPAAGTAGESRGRCCCTSPWCRGVRLWARAAAGKGMR